MNILSIETSCDETSIAIVRGKKTNENNAEFELLAHVLHSQIEQHVEFGGVYPNVARREHANHISNLVTLALTEAGIKSEEGEQNYSNDKLHTITQWSDREPELHRRLIQMCWSFRNNIDSFVDVITVTTGPGLAPALWIGVNTAKTLSFLWNKPVVAVNHMAGHALSSLYPTKQINYPALSLLVSGGHTEIVLMKSPTDFTKIGKTLDDAAGEAFDKVARMLGFDYPGGPEISRFANLHREQLPHYTHQYNLPLPMQHSGDLNFSFSGLKTAAKNIINSSNLDASFKLSFAREFEEVVTKILLIKLAKALTDHPVNTVCCGGGVFANSYLRNQLKLFSEKESIELLFPPIGLSGDNAIMIAMAGFWQASHDKWTSAEELTAVSNWSIDENYQKL